MKQASAQPSIWSKPGAWPRRFDVPPLAPHAEQAARLLAEFGRGDDAAVVCEVRKSALLAAIPEEAALGVEAEAQWKALACYRQAGLKEASRTAYRDFTEAKAAAIGPG